MTMNNTSFNPNEIPEEVKEVLPEGQEIRCQHRVDRKFGGMPCNKVLFKGKVSKEPQEFLCRRCGNKTTFRRIG